MLSRCILMAVPLLLLPLAGCETLTQTPAENGNMMAHACSTNGGEMVDDMDRLALLDRPSILSDKPVPEVIVNYNKVYPKGTPYFFRDNP
jgi:hypothetical protein